MKVKELIEAMSPEEFIYIESPSWGKGAFWYNRAHSDFVIDRFGDRYVSSITTEHDKGSSSLYIILEEEE